MLQIKSFLLSVVFVVVSCNSVVVAEDAVGDAKASVIGCMDKNIVSVERVFNNLNEASDFLVLRLCNAEITQAEKVFRAENKLRETAHLDKTCGELPAGVKDEPFNMYSEINFDEASEQAELNKIQNCRQKNGFRASFLDADIPGLLDPPTIVFSAYASKRLLNLRIARLDDESTGDK